MRWLVFLNFSQTAWPWRKNKHKPNLNPSISQRFYWFHIIGFDFLTNFGKKSCQGLKEIYPKRIYVYRRFGLLLDDFHGEKSRSHVNICTIEFIGNDTLVLFPKNSSVPTDLRNSMLSNSAIRYSHWKPITHCFACSVRKIHNSVNGSTRFNLSCLNFNWTCNLLQPIIRGHWFHYKFLLPVHMLNNLPNAFFWNEKNCNLAKPAIYRHLARFKSSIPDCRVPTKIQWIKIASPKQSSTIKRKEMVGCWRLGLMRYFSTLLQQEQENKLFTALKATWMPSIYRNHISANLYYRTPFSNSLEMHGVKTFKKVFHPCTANSINNNLQTATEIFRLWNPGQTSPEVRNRGVSGPTKRTHVPKKFLKKKKKICELSVTYFIQNSSTIAFLLTTYVDIREGNFSDVCVSLFTG